MDMCKLSILCNKFLVVQTFAPTFISYHPPIMNNFFVVGLCIKQPDVQTRFGVGSTAGTVDFETKQAKLT